LKGLCLSCVLQNGATKNNNNSKTALCTIRASRGKNVLKFIISSIENLKCIFSHFSEVFASSNKVMYKNVENIENIRYFRTRIARVESRRMETGAQYVVVGP